MRQSCSFQKSKQFGLDSWDQKYPSPTNFDLSLELQMSVPVPWVHSHTWTQFRLGMPVTLEKFPVNGYVLVKTAKLPN